MAVYEQTYRRYDGPLTSRARRFWVIPRYAWKRLAGSKLVVVLLVLAGISTLGGAVLIYLHHNLNALQMLQIDLEELVPINARFFSIWLSIQLFLAFLFVLIAGPRLISMDMSNGALPLYLARPLERKEYVLGKLSVLAVVVSLLSWVPGLGLYLLQAALAGAGWAAENLQIAGAIFASSWIWILWMGFVTLALSALLRWPLAVRGVLLVLYFVLPGFGLALAAQTRNENGLVLDLAGDLEHVRNALFGVEPLNPLWAEASLAGAVAMLGLTFAAALLLLVKKLRAYEVVS